MSKPPTFDPALLDELARIYARAAVEDLLAEALAARAADQPIEGDAETTKGERR